MKPRVILDVDGVLCDFVSGYLKLVREVTGRTYQPADVTSFDVAHALGLAQVERHEVELRISHRPGWWESLAPYPAAKTGLPTIAAIAELWFVTAPWYSCDTWEFQRYAWLFNHFGISRERVIPTEAKFLLKADALVDDRTKHLREWAEEHPEGEPIWWVTMHNGDETWMGRQVVDWIQLRQIVEGL